MKVSILFLYFSVVRATDDASLMQQGVGIESGVLIGSVNQQFQTHLANVQEALKEIPHQGKMRQMAIDSLMQAVAKKSNETTTSTPTVGEQLTQVVALLWDLLNGFQAEIENEVTALSNAAQLITDCNNAGVSTDEGHENASDDAHTTHTECRTGTGGEFSLRQTVETSCRDLINRVQEYVAKNGAHSTCTTHIATIPDTTSYSSGLFAATIPNVFEQNGGAVKDTGGTAHQHVSVHSGDWTTYLTTMKSFWDGQEDFWTTRASGCKTAVQNWDTKRDTCNDNQNTFEQAFCTWASYRRGRCEALTTCHGQKTTDFTNLNTTHTGHDNNRVAVAEIVQRVICLVGVLTTDGGNLDSYPTNTDACTTKVANNDTAIRNAMTRAKPTPDPIDTCDDVPRPYPSDAGTGGTQHTETGSIAGNAFVGWYEGQYSAITTTFTNENFPDNGLDLTTTAKAVCIDGTA